jgi:hypothetical protein
VADDDDRPRDAGSAADPAWHNAAGQDTAWADASAPDDISELSREVRAYHREVRANRRHEKYGRFLGRPTSEPLTLLGTALVLAAIVAAAITLVQPRVPTGSAGSLPLANSATGIAVGDRVPPATLSDGTKQVAASNLRPAVLALAPSPCIGCKPLIGSLADEIAASGIPLAVVAPPKDADAGALNTGAVGAPQVYTDTQTQLLGPFKAAGGLTLVVVNRDGTIAAIERNVSELTADLPAVVQQIFGPKADTG